jgi:TetR/AcrR family transcriptional regulator, transcriptional repressor of bet genes
LGRHKNTNLRQKQIVEGFAKAISELGYAGASIAIIAEKADLTPGLIHYHFNSKEEILKALIKEMSVYLSDRVVLKRETIKKPTPINRMEQVIGAFLDLDSGSNLVFVNCWTVIFAEAATNKTVRDLVHTSLVEQLDEIKKVAQEIRKGDKKRSVDELASLILASIQGYILIGTVAPGLIPRGSAAKMVSAMLLGLDKGS